MLKVFFVFNHSFGNSDKYVRQALFGDFNFLKNDCSLENDGLFAMEEWHNVSACCLSNINLDSGEVFFPYIWENPRACVPIPQPVLDAVYIRV